MFSDILPQVQSLLETDEKPHFQSVSGGDISQAFRLNTSGNNYFLKVNSSDNKGLFESEVQGLRALAASECLPVAQVLGRGSGETHSFLLLDWIESIGPREQDWFSFGSQLALQHNCTQEHFGFNCDNYIGSIPQLNPYKETWGDFFIEARIEPLVRKSFDAGLLAKKHLKAADGLAAEVNALFPASAPALLHGDLWTGNFLWKPEVGAVLIDPAVYYGHNEMELAFTQMFGGFHASFFEGYTSSKPIEPGFSDRIQLYNLYSSLVHLLLFGSTYHATVDRVLMKFYR